jgi:Rrf2 family protein
MKINSKVRYGLRAMIAIAQSQADGSLLQKDISQSQEIPIKYLDIFITGLRNNGLIVNTAGKGSGYRLSRKPSEISVYDVYRSFEPELTLVQCECPTMECKRLSICPVKDYWFTLNNQIKQLMMESTVDKYCAAQN